MKTPKILHPLNCLAAVAGLTALFTTFPAHADTRWWDGGTNDLAGDGNGNSAGGDGIWNTTLTNWDQGDLLAYTNWVNEAGDGPSFGGTPGTVTLGDNITVGGTININSGTAANPYTIAGGSGPYTLTVSNDANFGASGYGIITAAISGGSNSLTKAFGTGTLVLSGPTAFDAGTTVVSNGTLVIADSAALGTGNLSLFGGVLGLGNGDFSRALGTNANEFQLNNGGFAAFGTNRTVAPGTLVWGTAVETRIVGTLTLGASDADATVIWDSNLSFGGSTRTIQVDNGSARVDAIVNGQFVTNPGGLTKTGSGVLSLTASNSYSGSTAVQGGVLKLDHTNAIPGGVGATGGSSALSMASSGVVGLTADSGDFARPIGTGSNQVTWTGSGGFAAYGGTRTVVFNPASSITWSAANFIGAGRTLILSHGSADATLDWRQRIALGGARTVQVNNGSAAMDAIMSGVIAGGTAGATNNIFTKTGSGTLAFTGANTYYGATVVSNGTLMLGDGTGDTGRLSINSLDVVVAGGATLAVNRTGAVSQGANSPLGDNALISGDGGFSQLGSGTTTLTLPNTYAGPTTVSGGTLLVNNTTGSGTGLGEVTVNSSGTLGGTGLISGVVTVNSGGTLSPGASAGTLSLNSNLVLQAGATTTFEVDGSTPANNQIVLGGDATYGGVLNLVTSGTFTNGQSFVLFSGTGAASTSNFGSLVGSPGAGLEFSFTNGVLSVTSTGPVTPTPTNVTIQAVSGEMVLEWPNGQGWVLQSQSNPLSVGLSTNWVDVATASPYTNAAPAAPAQFYRLIYTNAP